MDTSKALLALENRYENRLAFWLPIVLATHTTAFLGGCLVPEQVLRAHKSVSRSGPGSESALRDKQPRGRVCIAHACLTDHAWRNTAVETICHIPDYMRATSDAEPF
jgi:hypothetical protein